MRLTRLLRQIGATAFSFVIPFIGLLAVTFVISRVVPIDPVTSILGERATQDNIPLRIHLVKNTGITGKLSIRRDAQARPCIFLMQRWHGKSSKKGEE